MIIILPMSRVSNIWISNLDIPRAEFLKKCCCCNIYAQYVYKKFVRKLGKLVKKFLQGNLPMTKGIKAEQESKALLQFLNCFCH
jgi:hypothetical protein